MGKDPAFLFYSSDFLVGTMFMSDAQVGKYIRLLCVQHEHGGIIDKSTFNAMVGKDDDIVRTKFIEVKGGFYNERLLTEHKKRQKYCESRRLSRLTYVKRMSNIRQTNVGRMENENRNINALKDGGVGEDKYPHLGDPKFKDTWESFLVMRKKIKSEPTDKAVELIMKKLDKEPLEVACAMLEQSIENGWRGIFPLKGKGDKNAKRKSVVEAWAAKRGISIAGDVHKGNSDSRNALPEPKTDGNEFGHLADDVRRSE